MLLFILLCFGSVSRNIAQQLFNERKKSVNEKQLILYQHNDNEQKSPLYIRIRHYVLVSLSLHLYILLYKKK